MTKLTKNPKHISQETLESCRKNGFMTIGDLKKWLNENSDLPDDSLVMIQRVEDKYYEGVDISGLTSYEGILPEGSKSEGWGVYYKETLFGEEQYHPAWCCVRYQDEKNLMFIDLHY
jgi:hypothetical protein